MLSLRRAVPATVWELHSHEPVHGLADPRVICIVQFSKSANHIARQTDVWLKRPVLDFHRRFSRSKRKPSLVDVVKQHQMLTAVSDSRVLPETPRSARTTSCQLQAESFGTVQDNGLSQYVFSF